MFALNIDKETKRILSVTYSKFAKGDMPIVNSFPEGNVTDYLYTNDEFIYSPIPKVEETITIPSEIEKLRADIDYIAIMTGVEL